MRGLLQVQMVGVRLFECSVVVRRLEEMGEDLIDGEVALMGVVSQVLPVLLVSRQPLLYGEGKRAETR